MLSKDNLKRFEFLHHFDMLQIDIFDGGVKS